MTDAGAGPLLSQSALEQQTLDAYQFGTLSLKSEAEEKKEEEDKKKAEEEKKDSPEKKEEKKDEPNITMTEDGVLVEKQEPSEATF